MKRFNSILACGLLLAVAGMATFTNAVKAAADKRDEKATVRTVHGEASYSKNGTDWMPLHPNTELSVGDAIKTGADGQVDLMVNGRASTVRVTSGTQVTLKTMDAFGAFISPDTETQLDLANGTVLGSVKKISGDSSYRISTPRGVAGIRGTDFAVQVTANAGGTFTVTFTSVTGTVVCAANVSIGGATTVVTKILSTGQSWTPPDTAATVDAAELAGLGVAAQNIVNNLPPSLLLPIGVPTPVSIIVHVPPNTTPTYTGGNGGNNTPPPVNQPPNNNDD